MKIGVASHIYWDFEKRQLDLPKALEEIKDVGFESTEILCDSNFFPGWGTDKVIEHGMQIKELVESLGLEVTIHGPHYDFNIATWNDGIRKQVMKQLKDCIKMAALLNTDIIVIHPGRVASNKFSATKTFNMMVKNMKELVKHAKDANIYFCAENMAASDRSFCTTPAEVNKLVDDVGSDHLKICFDIAHANTTKKKPEDFLAQIRKHVFHVHISDNLGSNNHMPIGLGNIDFKKVLSRLKPFNGILNIEGWMPHNKKHFLEWDRKQLVDMIKTV